MSVLVPYVKETWQQYMQWQDDVLDLSGNGDLIQPLTVYEALRLYNQLKSE